ncbi:EAL domain-containing protein [Sulfobacillus sp. hq2]|uniref:EAL domain-containing protein n=1 Tax=Sulfobacillus TaxID=28033 RepID=UPI001304AF19|nr:EAL domain-containing protein [Sulfobacillus sp. hq2]
MGHSVKSARLDKAIRVARIHRQALNTRLPIRQASIDALDAAVQGIMRMGADQFVIQFYNEIRRDPHNAEILDALTPPEWTRLQETMHRHLIQLMDPHQPDDAIAQWAYQAGQTHALVGLEQGQFVAAFTVYQKAVKALINSRRWLAPKRWAVQSFLDQRIVRELRAELQGFDDTRRQWWDALRQTFHVVAHEPLDLATLWSVVARSLQQAPGVIGVQIWQPQGCEGRWECLAASGSLPVSVQDFRALWDIDSKDGAWAAWWDQTMVALDRHVEAESNPIRSVCYVPLLDMANSPAAVLVLYGQYPHQWQNPDVKNGLELLALLTRQSWPSLVPGLEAQVLGTNRRDLARGHWEWRYQPIVDIASDRPIKWEQLARWRTEAGTLLAPSEFLPLMGLADHRELLAQGILALQHDASRLPQAKVSINVVPELLSDAAGQVILERAMTRFARGTVVLELLESGRIDDKGWQFVRALVKAGAQLALDDFGAGYANFDRLMEEPWAWVKFDRSFWRRIAEDPGRWIPTLGEMVNFVKTLGIPVIGEGIERSEHLAVAQALGMEAGQGFLWGRPESVEFWASHSVSPASPAPGGLWGLVSWHWVSERTLADASLCLWKADGSVPDEILEVHQAWHESGGSAVAEKRWKQAIYQSLKA